MIISEYLFARHVLMNLQSLKDKQSLLKEKEKNKQYTNLHNIRQEVMCVYKRLPQRLNTQTKQCRELYKQLKKTFK